MIKEYFSNKKTVVAGTGRWGINHVRKLSALLGDNSLGIVEPDATNLKNALNDAPGATIYENYTDALADPDVTAVCITAPAPTHCELTRLALEAGKHVFVEKPLALKVTAAQELVDTATRNELVLMVGHILLFDPAVRYIKDMYERGELGSFDYAVLERAKLGTVRRVEDVIFSLASHDIAQICYVLGECPTQVSCNGTAVLDPKIRDIAFISLHFPSGKLVNIMVSWLHPIPSRRLIFVCSKKSAIVDETSNNKPRLTIYESGVKIGGELRDTDKNLTANKGDEISTYEEGIYHPDLEKVDLLELEMTEFLQCIVEGRTPLTNGEQAVEVIRVMRAAQKSLTGNGTPVILES